MSTRRARQRQQNTPKKETYSQQPMQTTHQNSFNSISKPTTQQNSINSISKPTTPKRRLVMPSEIAELKCNMSLFGNFDSPLGIDTNLTFHLNSKPYSSPFGNRLSHLKNDITCIRYDPDSLPIWNFAKLPTDRTQFSNSSSSSSTESPSSNESDN